MAGTTTKGLIAEEDLALYDGTGAKNFTRQTSGGGVVTLTKVGAGDDVLDWKQQERLASTAAGLGADLVAGAVRMFRPEDYGADPSYTAAVNTPAIQACVDAALAADGTVFLSGLYQVDPALGVSTTRAIGCSDGFILPGWTYEVVGTGTVTYDGTTYDVGETFTGVFGVTGWTTTGTACPAFSVNVAIVCNTASGGIAGPNIRIRGNGKLTGLKVVGAGVGLGIFENPAPAFGGRTIGWYADLDDFTIQGDGTSEPQMGLLAEYACYYGRAGSLYLYDLSCGAYLHECWNWTFGRLECEGGGRMDVGVVLENSNQQVFSAVYTHNFRIGMRITTQTAHGGSLGDTAIACEDDEIGQYSGPIVKVVSATEFYAWPVTKTATPTISEGTCYVNSTTTALDYKNCNLRDGGIGVLATSVEGLWIHGGQFGHKGSHAALVLITASGTTGSNVGPLVIKAEVEGPANGVEVRLAPNGVAPVPNTTYGELRGIDIQISGFFGRDGSDTHFGVRHGVKLAYCRGGRVHGGFLSNRSISGAAVNISAATQANPCQITTAAAHGLLTGDRTYLASVGGMTPLNGKTYTVTVINATTFTLDSEDASAYPAYTSGGTSTQRKTENACIWLKDTCYDIVVEDVTYDHNVTNHKIIDEQTRPLMGPCSAVRLQNIDGPTLGTHANLAYSISPTHVQVSRAVRTTSLNDDSESRWPRYVKLRFSFAINTIGLNGTVYAAAIDKGGRFANWSYTPQIPYTMVKQDTTSGTPATTDRTITGVSNGNPSQITCVGHGIASNSIVWIAGVGGATGVNNARYTWTSTGADTGTIGVDGSGFGTYTTGGILIKQAPPTIVHEIECPVSEDGYVTYQVFVSHYASWDVTVTVQQVGAVY